MVSLDFVDPLYCDTGYLCPPDTYVSVVLQTGHPFARILSCTSRALWGYSRSIAAYQHTAHPRKGLATRQVSTLHGALILLPQLHIDCRTQTMIAHGIQFSFSNRHGSRVCLTSRGRKKTTKFENTIRNHYLILRPSLERRLLKARRLVSHVFLLQLRAYGLPGENSPTRRRPVYTRTCLHTITRQTS